MNGKQRIVSALNLQPVDRTPVWFMRQAGRHLPEYRKIAAEYNFWERCMDVDLCTKITLQPIERYKKICLLYTSPSPRDLSTSRMPSSA